MADTPDIDGSEGPRRHFDRDSLEREMQLLEVQARSDEVRHESEMRDLERQDRRSALKANHVRRVIASANPAIGLGVRLAVVICVAAQLARCVLAG